MTGGNSTLRVVLAGDAMPSRALTLFKEPEYLALVDLMRGADIAFANLETTVRHRDEGAPNFTQGTPMTTPPALLEDLKWMGFGLLSNANNHATDYGTGGVTAMLEHLRAARLPCAGAGANLAEARAPAYADTPAGRVAVVAATSFFRPWRPRRRPAAGFARPARHQSARLLHHLLGRRRTPSRQLKRVSDELGLTQERARHRAAVLQRARGAGRRRRPLTLPGQPVPQGQSLPRRHQSEPRGRRRQSAPIREARRQADFVIFSFHSHEFGAGGRLTAPTDVAMEEPAEFYVEFAKAAIDAGADIVAGHGPHLTLGIEIYRQPADLLQPGQFHLPERHRRGVPVPKSYGRFGLPTRRPPPTSSTPAPTASKRGFPASREFWESFVAELRIPRPQLTALRLHPLDLGHGRDRARARPSAAGARRGCAARARTGRGLVAKRSVPGWNSTEKRRRYGSAERTCRVIRQGGQRANSKTWGET